MDGFQCQSCHVRLQLTGVEALRDAAAAAPAAAPQRHGRSAEPSGTLQQQGQHLPPPQQQQQQRGGPAARLDESFVVLDGGQRSTPRQHEPHGPTGERNAGCSLRFSQRKASPHPDIGF